MTEEERLSVSTHLSGHLAMGVELTIPKPLQRTTTVPNFFADAVASGVQDVGDTVTGRVLDGHQSISRVIDHANPHTIWPGDTSPLAR